MLIISEKEKTELFNVMDKLRLAISIENDVKNSELLISANDTIRAIFTKHVLASSNNRRYNLSENTDAEKAIRNSMLEIEKLPADEKLSDAILLLTRAKEMVSDYVDSNPH